jgi:dTDP-4-amino-4,6-dideoxygalactose transaminase
MRKIPYVDLKAQHRSLKDELLEAVGHVLEEGSFILGPEVARFEKDLAAFCGTRYAVGLNSGTDALFLCLKAYGIGAGDEVITAPNSFLASAMVIATAGATPVFADIREDFTIDPALVERAVSPRTKALMPVHLTGKPADMDPLREIARRHGLKIVEDAAQAIGAEYRGKRAGSLADAGCFSLHPLKTLNACGDGGAVTTDDEDLYRKLVQLRNIGLRNRNESDMWGYNSRLDSMQAAILNVKMKYIEEWTDERRRNAARYREALKDVPGIVTPREEPYERQVYHTFIIRSSRRDELQKYLEERGVETRIHYPLPIHFQKAAGHLGYREGDFPVCEESVRTILSLPIYQGIGEENIEYIAGTISGFAGVGTARL